LKLATFLIQHLVDSLVSVNDGAVCLTGDLTSSVASELYV